MKLKSYFSATVESAMEMARKELGEEALLVNAKPTTGAARSLGAFEVVFGVTGTTPAGRGTAVRTALEPAVSAQPFPPPLPLDRVAQQDMAFQNTSFQNTPGQSTPFQNGTPQNHAASAGHLTQDLASLRRDMERMAQVLRAATNANLAVHVQQPELYQALVQAELDPELARRVADGAALEDIFQVDATLGRKRVPRAVVVLVGPPGAGKTTTLVKLAARYGLAARRPSHIISTDVHRIAAADQLRVLASILGIGCTVVETAHALEQVLEEHRNKEFVFVDTPGLARDEMDEGFDLARMLSAHPETDTHLVLPASMKPADLARTADQYAIFEPAKLLFTRLDETDRVGALVNMAARCALPLSFFSTGQQIPDHLEPATKPGLAARLLDAKSLAASALYTTSLADRAGENAALPVSPAIDQQTPKPSQPPAQPQPLVARRGGIREISKSFAAGVGV